MAFIERQENPEEFETVTIRIKKRNRLGLETYAEMINAVGKDRKPSVSAALDKILDKVLADDAEEIELWRRQHPVHETKRSGQKLKKESVQAVA